MKLKNTKDYAGDIQYNIQYEQEDGNKHLKGV